jgi:ADP-heptose:LPS heptosyltransferase
LNNILIISTTGMGDTLWGTPAIRAIKKKFPQVGIDLLLQPQWESLFHNNKNIRRLIPYYPQWYYQLKSLSKIIATHYDHVLIFHANKDIRRILPFLRSPSILSHQAYHGYLRSMEKFSISHPGNLKNKIIKFEKPVHGILRRIELVKNIDIPSNGTHMDIFLEEKDTNEAIKFLEINNINPKNFIYLNIGGSIIQKQWPMDKFISLSKVILRETSLSIVLGGGSEDMGRIEFIQNQLGHNRIANTKNRSLKKNCALINQSKVLITPDSGPMHIGFALKVPTIALFWTTDNKGLPRNALNGPEYCGPLEIDKSLYSVLRGGFVDIGIKKNWMAWNNSEHLFGKTILSKDVWQALIKYI